MSLQSERTPDYPETEQALIDYLIKNPDFFQRNPDVLCKLELPHTNGDVVSLIERQVVALREQAEQNHRKLEEFVAIARENELLNDRLHHLTVKLIECCDFDEVINTLQDLLHDDFRAEAVELHLYSNSEADSSTNPDLDGFREFLDGNKPRCGRFPTKQLKYLFGPQADDITSTALIPISGEGLLGILAIGSHSEHRFHPGMGTDYLIRLGEIVSKTLEVVSEPGL
ncbi:MAG: DUF484 family protein [Sedimenticola sp.]|uniref:DUF484 family protein n=1 Tax=Sedimenticola thiotaurini TaxID=1543721 RepID=A0A558DFI7_9GAMM|nr:DUF484 family protein [Sedimenticola sp.]MCW9021774.1 DUF484 family protein [Sedimenticola sp.]MDF1529825.1 DUF484 family protein [Sedimenticola sp.]TVT59796.1 MAG: DUF484 family protein [Sedimenticola thiotaurini]